MAEMDKMISRGRRLDNQEWVEGYFAILKWYLDEKPIAVIIPEDATLYPHGELCGFYPVDSETVGRFTSLTDKNGKKIFEGDIVVHEVQKGILFNKGVINWDAKNARWAHQLNTMNPCLCMFDSSTHEVIGNIHDNPELTKGE